MNQPRIISQEVFDRLDSLEQIVARQFILEGRWILKNEGNK